MNERNLKDYDNLSISAEPQSYCQPMAVEFARFCNYEHSTFIINPYTCTDEDDSTACSDTLLRLFVNTTRRYNNS